MSTVLSAHSITREVQTESGNLRILDDVSLSLKSGESLAIQGASGSGKSTLLGVLAGLDLPESGKVFVNGVDITRLGEDERANLRANSVGFVFQSFCLIEDLTALENVALPLELFGHQTPGETASDWLGRLGLADRKKHLPKQLSGGEQQRVALCRAFAVRPMLLFADEPTANLDTSTASAMLDQLFALQQELNTTMVIATHDSSLAERCDRILNLEGGRLVRDDTVEVAA